MKVLLDYGADPEGRNNAGRTALDKAKVNYIHITAHARNKRKLMFPNSIIIEIDPTII